VHANVLASIECATKKSASERPAKSSGQRKTD